MSVLAITHVKLHDSPEKLSLASSDTTTANQLTQALGAPGQQFVLGERVGQPGSIQVVSEDSIISGDTLLSSLQQVQTKAAPPAVVGKPTSFRVLLSKSQQSPFIRDRFVDAQIVEYIQNYFPKSRVDQAFKTKIEADFDRFYGSVKDAPGSKGVVYGWTMDDLFHEEIEGDSAVCFFVLRGWDSMGHFQQGMDTEAFRNNIGSLLAWKAPYELVSMLFISAQIFVRIQQLTLCNSGMSSEHSVVYPPETIVLGTSEH